MDDGPASAGGCPQGTAGGPAGPSGRSTQGLADSTGRADPADPSGGMRSALAQLRAGRPGADQSGCGDLGPWHAEGPDALSRPDYFTGRGWGACRPDYTR